MSVFECEDLVMYICEISDDPEVFILVSMLSRTTNSFVRKVSHNFEVCEGIVDPIGIYNPTKSFNYLLIMKERPSINSLFDQAVERYSKTCKSPGLLGRFTVRADAALMMRKFPEFVVSSYYGDERELLRIITGEIFWIAGVKSGPYAKYFVIGYLDDVDTDKAELLVYFDKLLDLSPKSIVIQVRHAVLSSLEQHGFDTKHKKYLEKMLPRPGVMKHYTYSDLEELKDFPNVVCEILVKRDIKIVQDEQDVLLTLRKIADVGPSMKMSSMVFECVVGTLLSQLL